MIWALQVVADQLALRKWEMAVGTSALERNYFAGFGSV
jgi:hypothetical protein